MKELDFEVASFAEGDFEGVFDRVILKVVSQQHLCILAEVRLRPEGAGLKPKA